MDRGTIDGSFWVNNQGYFRTGGGVLSSSSVAGPDVLKGFVWLEQWG